MSETELIKKATGGDHVAFMNLLKRYDRQLLSVVCRFTHDAYDRDDLYQDIFLHCFQSISRFRFKSTFRTWLYRLALNRSLAYVKGREPVAEQVDIGADSPDWERREKLAVLRRAMMRLAGPQRIAFHLFYVEDWSVPEIAQLLKCSEGAVKSHLDRARKKVRVDREVLLWQTNPI